MFLQKAVASEIVPYCNAIEKHLTRTKIGSLPTDYRVYVSCHEEIGMYKY